MSWQHNAIGKITGAPPASGNPSSFAWERDATQHIVYLATDNQIHEIWYRHGSEWKHGGALCHNAGAPAAAGNPAGYSWEEDDSQHILYRATDNQIHELWQRQGQGWKHGGALSQTAGAPPAASEPYGYVWVQDKTQHVVYRGSDNHIHELWQRLGQHWGHGGALSQATGAPLAAGNPMGFAWEKDETQHIVYRGADDQIHELWQKRGQGWKYGGPLSQALHAPASAGDPACYAWAKDESQHMLYRGKDNQVHELWYRHGSGWRYGGALNQAAGGPPAAGDPFGYAWEEDDTQHVVYRGADDQIHELWQRRGHRWEYGGALSHATGGPSAMGDPSGFVWEKDKSQHIVYRGADGSIHELWQRK